ncbi:MAG TPA: nitrilase-related carbon-nitrogen hydrolase [Anaerovoracaceae bacterium]|nr:nitrilase-related carbon-nitrogen hydrolase [Anaerovoracaceae bacterium]
MSEKISIVGIQTTPTMDRESNFRQAVDLMGEALLLHKHVDMVVLPEEFDYLPDNDEKDEIEPIPEEFIQTFSTYAKTYNTYITAGSVINRKDDGKVYNTSLLFDRKGDIVGQYDKIHLFDVLDGADDDKESYLVTRGDHLFTYEADFGKIGIIICYDVRFPELARSLALQGVQYLFVPAAFYMPRFDHWQSLLQSTALYNSMYVTGVNLYGKLDDSNVFCGRSLISDPWGVPVAIASDKAGFIQAYVDADYSETIKDAVGSIRNRVPSVYDIPK